MAHRHPVYDVDTHFLIDPFTRALKTDSSAKNKLIQYDHNSERITFEIPRLVENHDMSLCNSVRIHYINTGTNGSHPDLYEVDDLQISPDNEDTVVFSWLIGCSATQFAGKLDFLIRFMCIDDTGTIEYVWNTAIHSGISVSNGMGSGEVAIEPYSDILEKWKHEILSSAMSGGIYNGSGEMPEGYKLQLISNDDHNGSFVDLNGIINSPIVGNIDGNVILLSGNLDKGVYELRFNLANGNTATICAVEVK